MADWKPGDAAFCVRGGHWRDGSGATHEGPKKGQVVSVTSVACGGLGLHFAEFPNCPNPAGFNERRFVKLDPYQFTQDDLEVIDLYKRVPERALNHRASPCPAENILSQHGSLPGGDATTGGR